MQNAQLYAANVIGGSGDGDDEFVDAANAVSFARSSVDKRRSHFVIILCARDWTEMQYAPGGPFRYDVCTEGGVDGYLEIHTLYK